MNDSGPVGRPAVQAFFDYRLDDDELRPLAPRYKLALWLGAIGVVVGMLSFGLVFAAGLGAIGLSLGVALNRWSIVRELAARSAAKAANHAEFRRLARETRAVQGADVSKALVRVFGRTKVARDKLRQLERSYRFELERALLDEEMLERRAGDLVTKSIRMLTRGDKFSPRMRRVGGVSSHIEQLLWNPIRLVALFVTDKQLLICDVQIDSLGGDLLEEIQRISLAKIVNISFKSKRQRVSSRKKARTAAADPEDVSEHELEQDLSAGTDGDEWPEEEVISLLGITCSDGASVNLPIRCESYADRPRRRLDDGDLLSDDERMIDEMIDELNQLIDHAPRLRSQASER